MIMSWKSNKHAPIYVKINNVRCEWYTEATLAYDSPYAP